MHDQICVTADRACEMQIIRFGQSIMPERLCGVTRALQAFEQTDLQCLLFWFTADRSEKSLDFFSMRKIADFVSKAEDELAIFAQLFRIGIFVHTINRRD